MQLQAFFRAAFLFSCGAPMGWLAPLRHRNPLTWFLSARHRVTRASGSDPRLLNVELPPRAYSSFDLV